VGKIHKLFKQEAKKIGNKNIADHFG